MSLVDFSEWYGNIHGYLSLVVCLFGIPTNLINITVLTRKHMQTPINLILTWIAIFDMVTMVSYAPFVFHFYIEFPSHSLSAEKNSLAWMRFLLFYSNLSATTHTISIWLGVSLAIFRYTHIQSPETGNLSYMRRIIRCRVVIFVIIVGSGLLLIPNYMSTKIKEHQNDTLIYIFEDLKLGTPYVKPVVILNFSLYSIIAKFIPCLLMLLYGALLLRTLDMQVRIKRRKLSKLGVMINRPLHTSRTTAMLLIVMVLFLVTELPQGILLLMSLFIEGFFENVYIPLGDVMDVLALINNSINFVLYCSMNREFRRTLILLICRSEANLCQTRKSSGGVELNTEAIPKSSELVHHHNIVPSTDITTDDLQTGSCTVVTDSNGNPQDLQNLSQKCSENCRDFNTQPREARKNQTESYQPHGRKLSLTLRNDSSCDAAVANRLSLAVDASSGIDSISDDVSDAIEMTSYAGIQTCSV